MEPIKVNFMTHVTNSSPSSSPDCVFEVFRLAEAVSVSAIPPRDHEESRVSHEGLLEIRPCLVCDDHLHIL